VGRVLPPDVDPAVHDTSEARWVEVERAGFVLGVERNMVMGTPVLSFANEADARAAAERLHGTRRGLGRDRARARRRAVSARMRRRPR